MRIMTSGRSLPSLKDKKKIAPKSEIRFGIEPFSSSWLLMMLSYALIRWTREGGLQSFFQDIANETLDTLEQFKKNLPSKEKVVLQIQNGLGSKLRECPENNSFKKWMCNQNPEKIGIKISPLFKLMGRIQGITEGEFLYKALFTYYQQVLPNLSALNSQQYSVFRKLLIKEISFLEPSAQEFLKSYNKDMASKPVSIIDPRISIIEDALKLATTRKSSSEAQQLQILECLSLLDDNPMTQVRILKSRMENIPEMLSPLYKYRILSLAQFLSNKHRGNIIEWLSPICEGTQNVTLGEKFRRYLKQTCFFEKHKEALPKLIPMAGYLQSQLSDFRSFQMALFLNTKSVNNELDLLLNAYSDNFQRPITKFTVLPSKDAINAIITFLRSSEDSPKTFVIELPAQTPQLNQICTMFSALYNKGAYVTPNQTYQAAGHTVVLSIPEKRQDVLNSLIQERGLTEGFTSLTNRLGHGYHCQ